MNQRLQSFIILLLLATSCRGGGSAPEDGSSCSAASQPSGEVVITCDDGSTGVVEKPASCQLRPHPAGIEVNCPPSNEWLLIKNGATGKPGRDCVVLKTTVNNEYLTCDAKLNVTLVKPNGATQDTAASCSAVGLILRTSTGYCRGTAEAP